MKVKQQLLEKLSRTNDIPFLFVGSGMSRRYLNLETWSDLLRRFAQPTKKPFEYYLTKADGDYPKLATVLVDEFYDTWWTAPQYETRRVVARAKLKSKDSPLRVEIADYISSMDSSTIGTPLLEELSLLKNVEVDGIITTNWDRLLERIFPQFEVYVGQESLLFSQPQSIAEIYKIHGCCSDPYSMVLTAEDYNGFRDRNAYLAAKLLTVFVEHPVFFLGYSMTDPHILAILNAISGCLTRDRLNQLSDRLFFVEYDLAGNGEDVFKRVIGDSLPLTVLRTRDFVGIYDVLVQKKRVIPAKMLRKVKAHLYDLVRTNDPRVERYVQSFEDIDRRTGPEVYAGIGPISSSKGSATDTGRLGYVPIKLPQLIKDVIFNQENLDATMLLDATFPQIAVGNAKWFPIFKYLRESKRIQGDDIKTDGLAPEVIKRAERVSPDDYYPSKSYVKKRDEVLALGAGVSGILRRHDVAHAAIYISLLPPEQVDLEELERFLREHFDKAMGQVEGRHDTQFKSDFKRLVCYYDWLKYGPAARVQ